ncbi:MAG: glycosyltransferase [Propionibacteriaceae bacterium]|nr:glycosyltransferase [Propionibacteriaceae bacterium]
MHTELDGVLAAQVVFLYKGANRPADATARVVHELADRLRADGIATSVHGMDDRTHPHRVRPVTGGWLAQVRYALGKVRDQVAEGRFIAETAVALRRQPDLPQVIVSVDYPTGIGLAPVLARFRRRRRLHTISWVMDDFQDQKLQRAPWALEAHARRVVDQLALRQADTIVTIGSCMAQRISRQVHRTAEVIRVWADAPAGTPDPEAVAEVRRSWGATPETTVVLYSGHAAPHHPLGALVEAAAGLADEDGVLFVVSGVGVEMERLRRAPEAAALPNWRFGRQVPKEQVDVLLAAGDVHVVSLAEDVTGTCVPSKTYAALARHKPVLYLGSIDGQAAQDVVAAGAGLVVPSDDPEAVRQAVRQLADPTTREAMARGAAAWWPKNVSLGGVIDRWRAVVARSMPPAGDANDPVMGREAG